MYGAILFYKQKVNTTGQCYLSRKYFTILCSISAHEASFSGLTFSRNCSLFCLPSDPTGFSFGQFAESELTERYRFKLGLSETVATSRDASQDIMARHKIPTYPYENTFFIINIFLYKNRKHCAKQKSGMVKQCYEYKSGRRGDHIFCVFSYKF